MNTDFLESNGILAEGVYTLNPKNDPSLVKTESANLENLLNSQEDLNQTSDGRHFIEVEVPIEMADIVSSQGTDLTKICRTCLSEKDNLHSMFECKEAESISQKLTSLTHTMYIMGEGLPENICTECSHLVTQCYYFRQLVDKSESTLRNLLNHGYLFKLKTKTDNAPTNLGFLDNINDNDADLENQLKDFPDDISIHSVKFDTGDDNNTVDTKQNPVLNRKRKVRKKKKFIRKQKCKKKNSIESSYKSRNNEETVYICSTCNKSFSEQRKLVRHIKIHETDKPYVCTICNKGFNESGDLKRHSTRHTSEPKQNQPFPCKDCHLAFTTENDRNIHSAIHSKDGRHKCLHCKKEFKSSPQLRRHVRTHMQDKPHKCRVCGRGFPERCSLTRHQRTHTGQAVEKKHSCKHCGKAYADKHSLSIHERRHTGETPWVCAVCGRGFIAARLLNSHMKTHNDEKPYACKFCEKRFRHDATLTTHLRTHTGEKPYICSVCGKAFIQSSNLTLHMRTHSGERPYKCDQCGKRFAGWSTLTAHARIHSGEKPYQCNICEKRFARYDLSAHMRTHTGEKPYNCEFCEKPFKTSGQLAEHTRIHTGLKPFKCTVCDKCCATSSSLKKHIKSHQMPEKRPPTTKTTEQPKLILIDDDDQKKIIQTLQSGGIKDEETIELATITLPDGGTLKDGESQIAVFNADGLTEQGVLNLASVASSSLNLMTVANGEFSISTANSLGMNAGGKKLYQLDQSLLRIHNIGGRLTISKIVSKVTANF